MFLHALTEGVASQAVLLDYPLLVETKDPILVTDPRECVQCFLEQRDIMVIRELSTDAGLSIGHYGEEEANDIDAIFKEISRNVLTQFRIVEHDRHNRAVAFLDDQARLSKTLPPEPRVLFKLVTALSATAQNLQHLEGARN